MRKQGLIFWFCIFPFITFGADGVDGCLIYTGVTSQQRLYYIPYTMGAGSPTEWIATNNTAGFNVVTATKCFHEVGPPCTVYKPGTTGTMHTASDVLYSGNYAVVIPCPIDDYVPLAVLASTGLGIFIFRRRNFNLVG